MKLPKDDKNYKWTGHIKGKMLYYRISAQMIKNILRSPTRREEGIAPDTTAVMKRHDTPKRKEEIWIMYAPLKFGVRSVRNVRNERLSQAKRSNYEPRTSNKLIMISAWRYPGVSKPGKQIPIPDEILAEIKEKWF